MLSQPSCSNVSIIAGLALTILLPIPVYANGEWYRSFTGNFTYLDDSHYRADRGNRSEIYLDDGYDFDAAIVYSFTNSLRFESEIGYRRNDPDEINIPLFSITTPVGSEVELRTVFANAYYGMHLDSGLIPYIGAGIGLVSYSTDLNSNGLGGRLVGDSDTVLARQFSAGIGYIVIPNLTIHLGYRYLATEDPEVQFNYGGDASTEFESHNIQIGTRLAF